MAEVAPNGAVPEVEAPEASTSSTTTTTEAAPAAAEAAVNGDAETEATMVAADATEEAQQPATEVNGSSADNAVNGTAETGEPEVVELPQPTGPPSVETLYINNLNEKVPLKVMKESLKNLFKSYGVVLEVVMHSNVRMRGQAFVAMASREAAGAAVKEVKGFPIYGKPMNVSFARTPSDAVVKRKTPDLIDVHLEERKKRKSISRRRNPLRKKAAAAKGAAKRAAAGEEATAAPKRTIVQMPDEYLPPNKILFIQNLPETITKEDLEKLFTPYPNLHDVRLIPGRKGIAFVEYTDEPSSTAAREALHNYKVDEEHKMKVTYAKQ